MIENDSYYFMTKHHSEEEDDVPVERLESWYIYAHVHDKMIPISCGDASQRIKWLAHVAIGMSWYILFFLFRYLCCISSSSMG